MFFYFPCFFSDKLNIHTNIFVIYDYLNITYLSIYVLSTCSLTIGTQLVHKSLSRNTSLSTNKLSQNVPKHQRPMITCRQITCPLAIIRRKMWLCRKKATMSLGSGNKNLLSARSQLRAIALLPLRTIAFFSPWEQPFTCCCWLHDIPK